MTDHPTPDATSALRSFTLEEDLVLAGQCVHPKGTEIRVRKPDGGALRGLQMVALMQMDYAQLEQLAPRITTPILHKPHFAALDPADITQFGLEVQDFLLPKAAKEAASRTV